jgi:hypothetical protein
MLKHKSGFVAITAAALFFSVLALAASTDPSNKWRVVFNHTADNSGVIALRIAPVGLAPIDVETKIAAGTSENHAAQILTDSLKASLDAASYTVKVDDGEEVVIKARGKTPKFQVTLVNSSITGLTLKIKRQ